jgi:alpha-ribazole phosphatase/probable phosphoglycerate mutase
MPARRNSLRYSLSGILDPADMTEIVLLRHAEPESAGLYIGRGSDPVLSDKGRESAGTISPFLIIENPDRIYSSSQKRAMETVEPTARKLNRNVIIVDDLAEMDFGEWEGLGWKEIREKDPEIWRSWLDNPWEICPPGGETLKELQDRVVRSLTAILNDNPSGKVLIAAHGGPIRSVLGFALELEPSVFWNVSIDYASMCRFRRLPLGALELLQWNVPLG